MNKTYEISDDLKRMIGKENVVWNGKPKKSCFVLECIFNPALGFSIIWFLFDMIFMSAVLNATTSTSPGRYFVLIFISLHMMPVWMYLGGIISSIRKYRNTEYVVTDRGIYITGGFFAKRYDFKPFTDLSHVNVNRGVLDQFLGVGDVISECHHGHAFKLIDLPDYLEVCNLIKQYQTDIYADTQFPNGFRPTINSGYQTSYLPYERAPRNASYSYQDNYFNQPVDNVRDYSDNRIINNTINRPYNGNNSFNASSPYNRDNTYNADSSYNNNTYNNSAYNTNSSYSTNNTYSADSSYSKDNSYSANTSYSKDNSYSANTSYNNTGRSSDVYGVDNSFDANNSRNANSPYSGDKPFNTGSSYDTSSSHNTGSSYGTVESYGTANSYSTNNYYNTANSYDSSNANNNYSSQNTYDDYPSSDAKRYKDFDNSIGGSDFDEWNMQ